MSMLTLLIVLVLTYASQAGAEYIILCDNDWWKIATIADLQAQSDAGADIMAHDKYGSTPLHEAAVSIWLFGLRTVFT